MTTRPVAVADRERWLELWAGYNAFYERPNFSPEITDVLWARLFDPGEPVHGLVAEQGGRVVGLTHYLFHRSTTMIAHACYLQDLFTDASVRGRGVGRALIEAVYAAAREAGSTRVYWQTHETNATAMKLYDQIAERSGFLVYRKNVID
ncbi:MAG TPA: GNAT family N-acetyltransferase [Kofleriaceae bacterium]|nr:GNAT family N-acetyltransferase [Kofleriaceae bacterium]